jgi:hypothetical protein
MKFICIGLSLNLENLTGFITSDLNSERISRIHQDTAPKKTLIFSRRATGKQKNTSNKQNQRNIKCQNNKFKSRFKRLNRINNSFHLSSISIRRLNRFRKAYKSKCRSRIISKMLNKR